MTVISDSDFLQRLRLFSLAEGVSTLVLFGIAMPLKYLADMPMAVSIVGSVHGLLFIGLVAMFLLAVRKVPISFQLALAGILGAIVPGGPFVMDRWLKKVGERTTDS